MANRSLRPITNYINFAYDTGFKTELIISDGSDRYLTTPYSYQVCHVLLQRTIVRSKLHIPHAVCAVAVPIDPSHVDHRLYRYHHHNKSHYQRYRS